MLTRKEILRQIVHIAVGITAVLLIYYNLVSTRALFLLLVVGILLSLLSKRINLPVISFFLARLERQEYRKTFPGRGPIFYLVGILLVVKLFPLNIALAAIMILALGDSISHLIGERYGQIRNIFNGKSKKLLEGTVAGTIAGFAGALFFVPIPEAFLGSAAAMIAEVIEIDLNQTPLDDNVIVPLVAGTAMYLLSVYL